MGCMFCGKEIGPLRLLGDSEFCATNPGVAAFVTELSPADRVVHDSADLAPTEWTAGNERPSPRLPLAIDSVAGACPKPPYTARDSSAPVALRMPQSQMLEPVEDAPATNGVPPEAGFAPVTPADRPRRPSLDEIFPTYAAPASSISAAPRLPAGLMPEPVEDTPAAEEFPPEAGFIALEYYCERTAAVPAQSHAWTWRSSACILPVFGVQHADERLEELALRKEAAAKVVTLGKPAAKPVDKDNRMRRRVMELAAAGVLLATLTGYGARFAMRIGTETPAVKRDAGVMPARAAGGPLEKVRQVIASRASVELSDTFQHGMGAWGQAASWPKGWTHHSEGYVQTGQLAIFQPSLRFTDYRMEFFGQIESKSMGWVVRARDRQNYYAMKFTVIQPGLRPILAMVHYPVTGGHAGRPTETPLMEVMVHNNTPYHVAVTVEGNRIITSLEGQEVDRWIDDRIPAGGVGFYSDSGERARLYWMKVSKNEDFLGKLCAYLSGSTDASRALAMLIRPGWNYGNQSLAADSRVH